MRPIYNSYRWRRVSRAVRFGRALGYCEICGLPHGAIAPDGRSVILLSCAHLNGDVNDLRPDNLAALCPKCHFNYDQFRRVGALAEKHPALRAFLAGERTGGRPTAEEASRPRGEEGKRRTAKPQRRGAEKRRGRGGKKGSSSV